MSLLGPNARHEQKGNYESSDERTQSRRRREAPPMLAHSGSIPKIDVIVSAQNIRSNLHQQYSPASQTYAPHHTPMKLNGALGVTDKRAEAILSDSRTAQPEAGAQRRPTSREIGTSATASTSESSAHSIYGHAAYSTDVHTLTVLELEQRFGTDLDTGLDEGSVSQLLDRVGYNTLTPPTQEMEIVKWFRHTFMGVFNLLLWLAIFGQISLYFIFPETADRLDIIVPCILTVVIISAGTFQWFQERHSSQVMASFAQFIPQQVMVIRNGSRYNVPASTLVPGDLVCLNTGQKIPADVIILQASPDMAVDNSSLTGESEPQRRTAGLATSRNPMESQNIAFFGTLLLQGKGVGLVFKTGDSTLLGRIAAMAMSSNKESKSSHKSGADSNGIGKVESTFGKEIDHFVGMISYIAIGLALFCMAWDILHDEPFNNTMRNTVLILIANIPEGLRPTVTMVLTLSAKRMAKQHVLIKNLESVETLGCISVVCSDKTGTITCGRMAVSHVCLNSQTKKYNWRYLKASKSHSTSSLVRAAVLCNNAEVTISDEETQEQRIVGYPTETAILRSTLPVIGGMDKIGQIRETWPMVHEIPFNSENKWHLGIYSISQEHRTKMKTTSQFILIIKGAPEKIVDYCSHILLKDDRREMNREIRTNVLSEISKTASKGERVLCFAQAYLDGETYQAGYEFSGDKFDTSNWQVNGEQAGIGALTYLGFMSLIDPPRNGVVGAIRECHSAGIRVVMVTGDHEVTAAAIARQVGIIRRHSENQVIIETDSPLVNDLERGVVAATPLNETSSCVITGEQIDKMIEKGKAGQTEVVTAFWDHVLSQHGLVFARTTPMHKMLIVSEFQKRGEIVAVTGDGVNDAPALTQANVGIAMGCNGTDVARESADIVLLNDNFASIVAGISEGRLITDNLKKSIAYTLCSKLPQLAPVLARNFFDMPLAMTMMGLLLIDLGTDIWTGVAMAFEKREDDLMKRKPRDLSKSEDRMVNWKMIVYSYLHVGVIQMLACFFVFQQIMYNNGHGVPFSQMLGLESEDHAWGADASYFCYESDSGGGLVCDFGEYVDINREYHHHLSVPEQVALLRTAQTGFYASLVIMQIVAAICTSTRMASIFTHGLPNKPLNAILVAELAIACVCIYTSVCQEYLETHALPLWVWFAASPFALLLISIEEVRKFLARRQPNGFVKQMLVW